MERSEMRGAAWTREEDALLRKVWADVVSVEMLTKHFPGRSRNALLGRAFRLKLPCKLTTDNGKRPPGKNGRRWVWWADDARRMRAAGATWAFIASKFNVSQGSVRYQVDDLHLEHVKDAAARQWVRRRESA